MQKDLKTRFWAKLNKAGSDECWLWPGVKSVDGYGRIKENGKILRAHRVSYELSSGPIPDGMVVCHSCDTPACCNPNHLWLGTIADNNKDRHLKGRSSTAFRIKGEDHYLSRFTNKERDEMRGLRERGLSFRKIAAMYSTVHSAIQNICK